MKSWLRRRRNGEAKAEQQELERAQLQADDLTRRTVRLAEKAEMDDHFVADIKRALGAH
jgi:hypothetical protein